MHPGIKTVTAAALTGLLAGCGVTNPYQSPHTAASPTSPSTSPSSGTGTTSTSQDDPSDRPAGNYPPSDLLTGPTGSTTPMRPSGDASPAAALGRYARIDTNWTSKTVAATQRQLAAMSVGQARASALQAAASYSHDRVLISSRVTNTGTVIAIAPDRVRPGSWIVVTSEQTVGQGDYAGLPAQLHITYAQVAHTARGFVISDWSPQT